MFRGRAVPIVWRVLEHQSSSVSFQAYKDLLSTAARLLPIGVNVVFLADRGFADTSLMKYVKGFLILDFGFLPLRLPIGRQAIGRRIPQSAKRLKDAL